MAFSLFGKRDKPANEPSAEQQPNTAPSDIAEPEPARRSFFDRMREAVTRTRESLSNQIASVVALTREVDEASLDDLEFALLGSDIGAPTTDLIISRLRDRALRHGLANGAELKAALKDEIRRILDAVGRALSTTLPLGGTQDVGAARATWTVRAVTADADDLVGEGDVRFEPVPPR